MITTADIREQETASDGLTLPGRHGIPGDWMVNVVSTGAARNSIIRLTETDAFEIFNGLVKLMKNDGWHVGMYRENICKLSFRGSDDLYISVSCATDIWDVRRPPQHWLERGITKAVAS